MLEFTLIVWLAKGGHIEQSVDAQNCRMAIELYRQSLATGRPLLHLDAKGQRQPVLDVRCQPRQPSATS
ncbi:MAG: hypothetical protein R3D67_09500 [Hyphomicrobiaceae bacterium]